MKAPGIGDKPGTNTDVDHGLSERESFDNQMKLRGETNEATQRPTSETESLSTDRGTFKCKC